MAYQTDGDDEQNRMQVKFSSQGKTGDLGLRSKCSISLNFGLYVIFKKKIIPNVCVLSQIKDRKHIEQHFHSVAGVIPHGWVFGCYGGQKF